MLSSVLTLLECRRSLVVAEHIRRITARDAGEAYAALARAEKHWSILQMTDEVLERAARAFPKEPVRSLDAIHLASVLQLQRALPELCVLSLDDRVRENVKLLGIPLCL